MSDIYVIDACSLINASQQYNMSKRTFSHIWETLENMIEDGTLISSTEIMEELKDDDLIIWAKRNKECFKPITKEIQQETTSVLKRFPNLIKIRSTSNSNGDPFLIATAIANSGIIVTDEKLGDEKTKDHRIPNVCKALNIKYMNLHTFLDEILE